MSVEAFLDTNVVAYSLTNDQRKKAIATALLLDQPAVSVQVINELGNVATRRLGLSRGAAIAAARMVMDQCEVLALEPRDVTQAFLLSERDGFGHWDALIVAVALRGGCQVLYTEDLQHGQVIPPALRIRNPFLEPPGQMA